MEGPTSCPDCGAEGVVDEEECRRLFEDVIEREFSRPELFKVHRLTVDAYSLQHPDRYMKSAKSAAAHLTGMCWAMEHLDSPAVSRAMSRWLNGSPSLPEIDRPPPGRRGQLTIRHVHGASVSAEHLERVQEWAESTWAAWEGQHAQARAWVEEVMSKIGPRR